MAQRREYLKSWVTLSCWRDAGGRTDTQTGCCSHELTLHQPPGLAQLSPKAFWEKGREDRRLPSSHSHSCGDDADHKWNHRPVCTKWHQNLCLLTRRLPSFTLRSQHFPTWVWTQQRWDKNLILPVQTQKELLSIFSHAKGPFTVTWLVVYVCTKVKNA